MLIRVRAMIASLPGPDCLGCPSRASLSVQPTRAGTVLAGTVQDQAAGAVREDLAVLDVEDRERTVLEPRIVTRRDGPARCRTTGADDYLTVRPGTDSAVGESTCAGLTSVGVEAGAEGRERAVRAADDPVSRSGCGPGDACGVGADGAEADAPPADGSCGGTPTAAPEGAAAASAPEVSRDSDGPGNSAG